MIALVDCNNFFASCEKVFNPALKDKPVIVLSNNDGCVVARSKEVKKLGIPMGIPLFKIKNEIAMHNIHVFSSNFQLYSDMSRRVIQIIKDEFQNVEIYSIDEAFIDLSALRHKLNVIQITERLRTLREKILKYTGITVSIGIAKTKTLSKVANEYAKKRDDYNGVLNFEEINKHQIDDLLSTLPINEVWGVGYRYTQWLRIYGVNTALQLKHFDRYLMKKKFGVMGERIIIELNGSQASEIDTMNHTKKSIVSSCSFPTDVVDKATIERAISYHTSAVAEKLRKQNSIASIIGVFLITNRFKTDLKTTLFDQTILSEPTSYTPKLVTAAIDLLYGIFDTTLSYKKCGVILLDIRPLNSEMISLFDDPQAELKKDKSNALMKNVDMLNQKWGKGTIKTASEGYQNDWQMRECFRSPRYTTCWSELPVCS